MLLLQKPSYLYVFILFLCFSMPKAHAQLISPPIGIQNPEEGFGPGEPWPDTYAGQVSAEYVSLHERIRESPAYGRYWHVQTTSLESAMISSEGLYISFPPEMGGATHKSNIWAHWRDVHGNWDSWIYPSGSSWELFSAISHRNIVNFRWIIGLFLL